MNQRLLALVFALSVVATSCSGGGKASKTSTATTTGDGFTETTLDLTSPSTTVTTVAPSTKTTTTKSASKRKVTTTTACPFHGDRNPKSADGSSQAIFTQLNVGTAGCYDRAGFQMRETQLSSLKFAVFPASPPFTYEGSGKPVTVKGNSFLKVVLTNVTGYDYAAKKKAYKGGPTVNPPPNVHRIVQLQETGDSKGTLTWIIGLDAAHPFAVQLVQNPARFVVKVGN